MTIAQQKTEWVKAKDLTTNHMLQLEDGSWKRIKSVNNGFYYKSKHIMFTDGRDTCLMNADKVEAILMSEESA